MPQAEPPTFAKFTINNASGAYVGTYAEEEAQNWIDCNHQVIDPAWSFVDPSGHFHAVDSKSSDTPTLRAQAVRVACDGSCPDGHCDGYPATRFACLLCDAEVVPRYKTVTERVPTAIDYSWRATIQGPLIALGSRVSVLIQDTGFAPRFGVAKVDSITIEWGSETTMELTGLSRLGYRPV
jgi:hypothetical protein